MSPNPKAVRLAKEFHRYAERVGVMSVLESATESANRIIHGDTNETDVQLVAGVLLQILAQPRWSSEFRTGTEWVPLEKEVVE